MNPGRIDRTITRIAFQIFEDTRGSDRLLVLGIQERGYLLACRLSDKLTAIYGSPVTARALRVKDKAEQGKTSVDDNEGFSVDDKKLVIVDDVMYSGRTMFEAIRQVTAEGRPDEISLAALIDRGHRRYPVDIRYKGLYSPTKLKEHVQCRFNGNDEPEGVWLIPSRPNTY